MRTVVGGLVIAIALFVGAAVCAAEAGLARRIAEARERLATLHYDSDDGIDETAALISRLPGTTFSLGTDVARHRALVAYWQARYPDLTASLPTVSGNTGRATADPEIMFVAANAAFRASQADTSDRLATVDRLDEVIRAYAEVLRLAPQNVDASFNYEYVAKFRDVLARNRPSARETRAQKRPEPIDVAVDLPAGRTVHGPPGGPPPDLAMERFKMLTPLQMDEREEAGRGTPPRRKG